MCLWVEVVPGLQERRGGMQNTPERSDWSGGWDVVRHSDWKEIDWKYFLQI